MCIFNKKVVKVDAKLDISLLKQIVKLGNTENEIYTSTVQRKCSVGYVKAQEHIEWLLKNNYLTKLEDETPKYTITTEQLNSFKNVKLK